MSPRVRHEEEKEQMRQLILEAAIAITTEVGYENLSMRKIATRIGYTPTTIYLYYKDKEAITADLMMIIYQEIVSNVQQIFNENQHLRLDQQFKLALETFIETIARQPEMSKVIVSSGAKAMFNSDSGDEDEEHGVDLMQQLLVLGQQQGLFRPLDENVSWMILTALIGFSINAIENEMYNQPNWKELVHLYTEFLIHGLVPKEVK